MYNASGQLNTRRILAASFSYLRGVLIYLAPPISLSISSFIFPVLQPKPHAPIMKPYVAAVLIATVAALPIPKIHFPCNSRQGSEYLSPNVNILHQVENQQLMNRPRMGKDQVAIIVEVKLTEIEANGEDLEEWSSMAPPYPHC